MVDEFRFSCVILGRVRTVFFSFLFCTFNHASGIRCE